MALLGDKRDNNMIGEGEALAPSHLLTHEETREILTPFAFEIDKSLFGTKLASPYRRGFALIVDMLAIAILSGAPGELLAIVIAVTFYRLGSPKRAEKAGRVKGVLRRKLARITGALIIFMLLMALLPQLMTTLGMDDADEYQQTPGIVTQPELDLTSTIVLAATIKKVADTMKSSECSALACWQKELSQAIDFKAISLLDLDKEFIDEGFNSIAEETQLNAQEREQLMAFLHAQLAHVTPAKKLNNQQISQSFVNERTANDSAVLASTPTTEPTAVKTNETSEKAEKKEDAPIYSIVEYAKGLINDLGLGFGWAAFYFTVLTSVWKGQTLGKKLFSIRVLQLDGTPLSLWDSFGRYGGYGAGLATGLLGFIQIFWDANRQAIHDKISATVVVDANQQASMVMNTGNEVKDEESI